MSEEKISPLQATTTIIGFFLGTSIVLNTAAVVGADAWFAIIVSTAGGLVFASMTATLAALHPGRSLADILVFCFGRVAGLIIGFGYLLYTVWLSSVVMLTLSYYDQTVNYPETPTIFISICYMLVVAFAVRIGLEAIGRISEVLIVVSVFNILLTLLSLSSHFQPDAFLPVFKDGIAKPFLFGLKQSVLPFSEIFLALNILPNLNDRKRNFPVAWWAVLISGAIELFFVIRSVSILGVDMTARNVYPPNKVFRLMPGLDITPLLDINVIIFGIIKVSFIVYGQARILGDLFRLKEFKLFVPPLAALDVVVSSFIHRDIFSQLFVAEQIVPLVYISILVVIPLIMVIISLIKKEKPGAEPPVPE